MSGRNPRRNRGGPSARSSLSTTSTGMPRNKFDKGVKYDPFSNAMTYGGGLASNFQGRENNRNRQGNNKSLERRLIQARKTGNLALPNQQFTSFPPEVCGLLDEKNITKDEKWWECVELTALDLSNNLITAIPDAINNLTALGVLLMNHNKLATLPSQLFELEELKKVGCSNNLLTHIPAGIVHSRALVDLNLAHNRLVRLPNEVGQLPSLEVLNVEGNALEELPASLGHLKLKRLVANDNRLQLTDLQVIELKQNRLHTLPSLINLVNLTYMDVRENELTQFPALPSSSSSASELSSSSTYGAGRGRDARSSRNNTANAMKQPSSAGVKLHTIHAGFNRLTDLSPIHVCTSLSTLEVRDNHIKEIPVSLLNLPLKHIDVANNDIADLPAELGVMECLNVLVLDGNPLKRIPRSKLTQGIQHIKKYLRARMPDAHASSSGNSSSSTSASSSLSAANSDVVYAIRSSSSPSIINLKDKKLVEVPQEIYPSSSEMALARPLHELDLSANRISSLPAEFADHFHNTLRVLKLSANDLNTSARALSPRGGMAPLYRLTLLQELDLSNNQLAELPSAFSHFRELHTLDLRRNQFYSLPTVLLGLPRLSSLLMGYNKLQSLPSLQRLAGSLCILDVSNNSITDLDTSRDPLGQFRRLEKLESLNLENNNITDIPLELGVCKHLKAVMINGNPQRTVKFGVIRKGSVGILEYLKNKISLDSPLLRPLPGVSSSSSFGAAPSSSHNSNGSHSDRRRNGNRRIGGSNGNHTYDGQGMRDEYADDEKRVFDDRNAPCTSQRAQANNGGAYDNGNQFSSQPQQQLGTNNQNHRHQYHQYQQQQQDRHHRDNGNTHHSQPSHNHNQNHNHNHNHNHDHNHNHNHSHSHHHHGSSRNVSHDAGNELVHTRSISHADHSIVEQATRRLEELQRTMEEYRDQLDDSGKHKKKLSSAQRFALNKKLKQARALQIREERKLKNLQQ